MLLIKLCVAALSIMLIGYLWYHPRLFGGIWMRLVALSPEMVERGRRRSHSFMALAFISALLIAIALQMISHAIGGMTMFGALLLPLIAWIGFIVPTAFTETLWEERSFSLFAINAGYWLIALIVASLVVFF